MSVGLKISPLMPLWDSGRLLDMRAHGEPLCNKARELVSMSPRAIGMAVSEVAKQAANDCTDEHMQVAIEAMSTHWMRHTNATHRLMAGASLETTQDELGHSSINTTRIYAKASNKQREEDAELLAAFRN